MKFSYHKQNITPNLPCHMEGYDDRIATSIHDSLYLHSLCFNETMPIIIHVFDVIIITKEFAHRVKKACSEKFGVLQDHVLVTCIHTHSGPLVSNLITENLEPELAYMDSLLQASLDATAFCLQHLEEAKLSYGQINIDGFFCNRNGKNLPNNPIAYLFKIVRPNNEPFIDVVHFGCHPTVLHTDNLAISSDFIGAMRTHYELLTGTPLMFLNGEGGDVSTRLTRQASNFEEVERIGSGIAQKLVEKTTSKELSLDDLFTQSYSLNIDYDPKQDEWLVEHLKEYENKVKTMDPNSPHYKLFHDMYYMSLKKIFDQEHISLQPTTTIIEFSDFRIVTIPGELVYEFGRRMRNVDDKAMILLTYTNDFNIYAVNKEQYGQYFESFNTMYPYGKADEMIEATMNLYKPQ